MTYPVIIIEDRYGGSYSGGGWIAIAQSYKDNRFELVQNGANGDDVSAMDFWQEPPSWVAIGKTPDEALANLKSSNNSVERQ